MCKELVLTKGYKAIIDDEDFERVSKFKWSAMEVRGKRKTVYAKRGIKIKGQKQQSILLHRFLMNAPNGFEVDHENGNGLDCRKSNLRVCTRAQNLQNSKLPTRSKNGFFGVYNYKRKTDTAFIARINFQRKQIHLGIFENKEDAAKAYDKAAIKYHGKFAKLNFPEIKTSEEN